MQGNYFPGGMPNGYGQSPTLRSNNANFNPYINIDPYRNYNTNLYNYSSNYGVSSHPITRTQSQTQDYEEFKIDPVYNQYSNPQQEQISSPYSNKPKPSQSIPNSTKRPKNLQLQNKPLFNASLVNQSQTPKPKSTIEKNKASSSTFTLASNNILSNNTYNPPSFGSLESLSSPYSNKPSIGSTTSSYNEITSNNYHPLILNNQMTSNRNNYLSSHGDSENIRVVNPVLSSSSAQNRIIGNPNTNRRREAEFQLTTVMNPNYNQNTQSRSNNFTSSIHTQRANQFAQFNQNLDYISSVIAQSLNDLNEDDSIYEDIENNLRSNNNQIQRSQFNTYNTNSTSTLFGNQVQPIRYPPAYEYLPRLGNLSDVIPINSQTGRFYLGRDRNQNILRGRITLGNNNAITVSLSDMNGGGETIQTFPNPNALAEIGGLDAIVTSFLGDNLEHVEWLADFFESLFSHFTGEQQQQIIEKNKSKGLSEQDIENIPVVEYKKPSKKKSKKEESNEKYH